MRTFTKLLSLSLTSLLLATTLAACDGDDDNGHGPGPGPAPHSVRDDDRKVSSLTPDQLKEACQDQFNEVTEDQIRATAKVICTIQGALSGACDAPAIATCTDEFIDEAHSEAHDDCGVADPTKCDVTVGELASCQLDQVAAIAGAAPNVTCENVFTGGIPQENPASCKVVEERCPSATE